MSVTVKEVQKGFKNVESYLSQSEDFKPINEAFKKFTGGKTLGQLMEEGRVFDLKGNALGKAGIPQLVEPYAPAYLREVCDVMKGNGIMILDEKAGNRPRHVYFDVKKNELGKPETLDMYASDPINKEDLTNYLNSIATSAEAELEKPSKPGVFNQLLDGISRFFGGDGTEEMISYRRKLDRYNEAKEDIKPIRDGNKKLETEIKNAPELKEGLENYNMLKKAVGPDRLGYEFGSPEWNNDFLIHDTFKCAILDVATKDADIMKLIINMGADGSIKQMYDAFKVNYWEEGKTLESKEAEVQKMLKDVVAARSAKGKAVEKVPVKTGEELNKSNDAPKLSNN